MVGGRKWLCWLFISELYHLRETESELGKKSRSVNFKRGHNYKLNNKIKWLVWIYPERFSVLLVKVCVSGIGRPFIIRCDFPSMVLTDTDNYFEAVRKLSCCRKECFQYVWTASSLSHWSGLIAGTLGRIWVSWRFRPHSAVRRERVDYPITMRLYSRAFPTRCVFDQGIDQGEEWSLVLGQGCKSLEYNLLLLRYQSWPRTLRSRCFLLPLSLWT